MKSLFVDSFFFFAILNPKDAAHSKAIEFSKQHTGPLLTTSWVFTEVADGLARSTKRDAFMDNSVSVRHYCVPCIKSVSWIHGKTSKTDRR